MAYTNIDDPSAHFQVALYTGSNNQSITNDGNSDLQPDFVWIKRRSDAENHIVTNSTTGVDAQLLPNSTIPEQSRTDQIQSFDTDGFTLGTDLAGWSNVNGSTYVAWQWKANAGNTSSNTDGDLTSIVQFNSTAGFSIVTYTGKSPIEPLQIGHGMGEAPDVVLIKNRDDSRFWIMYHKNLTAPAANRYLMLDNNVYGELANSTLWGNVAPSSTIITTGENAAVNQPNLDFVAYCWKERQGFSKFGKYVGNGNSLGNGPFVYTGFAPSFIIIRRIDAANDWIMHTYKLGTKASSGSEKGNVGNLNNAALRANETSTVDDWGAIDMLSNGFKIRTDAASENTSGGSYIYMAFAEHPFTTSTGIPTTAR